MLCNCEAADRRTRISQLVIGAAAANRAGQGCCRLVGAGADQCLQLAANPDRPNGGLLVVEISGSHCAQDLVVLQPGRVVVDAQVAAELQ